MKVTGVRVIDVEGPDRQGMAIYETARGGLPAGTVTPYRETYTVVETDEGITGMVRGGTADVKAVGRRRRGPKRAGVPPAGWSHPRAHPRLRRDARLLHRAGARGDAVGRAGRARLYRPEVVPAVQRARQRERTAAQRGVDPGHPRGYDDFYAPKDGYYYPPTGPGFGYALDPEKILRQTELYQ